MIQPEQKPPMPSSVNQPIIEAQPASIVQHERPQVLQQKPSQDLQQGIHQPPLPIQYELTSWSTSSRHADMLGQLTDFVFRIPRNLPVTWLEIIAVVLGVFVVDFCCYQGEGGFKNTGLAVMLATMPRIIWLSNPFKKISVGQLMLAVMTWLATANCIYSGSLGAFCAGIVCVFLFAAARLGIEFYLAHLINLCITYLVTCLIRMGQYVVKFIYINRDRDKPAAGRMGKVIFPIISVIVFSWIFIMANPNLQEYVNQICGAIESFFVDYLSWLPELSQVLLWLITAILLAGLVAPRVLADSPIDAGNNGNTEKDDSSQEKLTWQFGVNFNTLLVEIVLFAVYLLFEFATITSGHLPEGFCYSTYCHQGAAWLTLALAVTTLFMLVIFRNSSYKNPGIKSLQALAMIWIIENFVLAGTVYNRMWMYINFNGLTTMRIFGLLGITAVTIGLIWILIKIYHCQCDVFWVFRRYTATVAVCLFVFIVIPWQQLCFNYNVNQILSGNPRPSVQLWAQYPSTTGLLLVFSLLDCKDARIQSGAKVYLTHNYVQYQRRMDNWREYCFAEKEFERRYEKNKSQLLSFSENAEDDFIKYVVQWY